MLSVHPHQPRQPPLGQERAHLCKSSGKIHMWKWKIQFLTLHSKTSGRAQPCSLHPLFLLHPTAVSRWGWMDAEDQAAPYAQPAASLDGHLTFCTLKVTESSCVFPSCGWGLERLCFHCSRTTPCLPIAGSLFLEHADWRSWAGEDDVSEQPKVLPESVLCFQSQTKEFIALLEHTNEQEFCFPPKQQWLVHHCSLGPERMTIH